MSDTRRASLLVVSFMLLLGAVMAAAWHSTEPERIIVDTPILTANIPSDRVDVTTTTAPAEAAAAPASRPRRPVAPPKQEYAPEPVIQIGSIEIPKIGLTHPVFHGITMRNIDRGPSHWPGTAMPGEVGNAVFAGHRVTKTHPFRNIHQLVPGDEVFFTIDPSAVGVAGPVVRTRYIVTGHEVVPPTALQIVDPTPTPTATLFACHPPGSARYRYVVRLALAA